MAGGNQGINFPLSEIVSWILEPLASAMQGSTELISGKDFKNMLDNINTKNKDWVPETSMKGDLGDHPEMTESEFLPKLCDCESAG